MASQILRLASRNLWALILKNRGRLSLFDTQLGPLSRFQCIYLLLSSYFVKRKLLPACQVVHVRTLDA